MFVYSNAQCSLIPGFVDLKKCTTRKLQVKFFLRKMRTAVQETAPQIALRNCSREEGEKVSIYVTVVKGEYMELSTYFSRRFCQSKGTVITMKDFDTRIRLIKSVPDNIQLSGDLSRQFFPEHSDSFLFFTLNSFWGMLKISHCSSI